jgi:pilus assembly protein CpaB
MKSKTMILMMVAIGCGLVASYMTSRVIAERGTKDVEEEKVTVLVAKQNLPMGQLIKDPEKYFEEKQFTKGEEPRKAIQAFDQLKDHRLNKPLSAEQFVTPDDLTNRDSEGLQGMMQKGKRAVALKVNADSAVGGFVLPHSRIDIVSVISRNDTEKISKIILQNILVLAVDQTQIRPDDKQAVVANTVTVEVTPAQAEALSLATEMGTLRLILRSFGDEEKVTTVGVTPKGITTNRDKADETFGDDEGGSAKSNGPSWAPKLPDLPAKAPPAVAQVQAPEPPPPPKTFIMTIFNGEAVTKAVFTEAKDGEKSVRIEKSQPDRPLGTTPTPAPAVAPAK